MAPTIALRGGPGYGTILVDAAAHRVIDLLEDPLADALLNWLDDHEHADVEVCHRPTRCVCQRCTTWRSPCRSSS